MTLPWPLLEDLFVASLRDLQLRSESYWDLNLDSAINIFGIRIRALDMDADPKKRNIYIYIYIYSGLTGIRNRKIAFYHYRCRLDYFSTSYMCIIRYFQLKDQCNAFVETYGPSVLEALHDRLDTEQVKCQQQCQIPSVSGIQSGSGSNYTNKYRARIFSWMSEPDPLVLYGQIKSSRGLFSVFDLVKYGPDSQPCPRKSCCCFTFF